MKKLVLTICLVFGSLVAPMAMADTVTLVGGYGPYQTGSGGEFTFTPTGNLVSILSFYVSGVTSNVVAGSNNFQTFCVENTEYVYANATFDAAIGQTSVYTGKPLTLGAAWLYYEFTKGTSGALNGTYNFSSTTPARFNDGGDPGSDNDLQQAIWYYMGVGGDPNNAFTALAESTLGVNNVFSANNGEYSVAVLNLWAAGYMGEYDYRRQDMLVRVPEPGILILLGIATSAIGAASWRIRRL